MAKLTRAARALPGALRAMGWSQRKLEREIPVANGYVNKLVHGIREPNARVASRIEVLTEGRVLANGWGDESQSVSA